MKKLSLLTQLTTVAFAAAILFTGCKKENSASDLSPQQEEEIATASSEAEFENELVTNDVFDNVLGVNAEVGLGGTGVFGKISSGATDGREARVDSIRCFTVTIVKLNLPNLFPIKITTDFGAGCTGRDGHTRYGKIITTYTGRLTAPGMSATTTFENYKIDSISVQGKFVIANTTAAGSNQRQFVIETDEMKLTKPNGNYSLWSGRKVITQVEGNGTPDFPIDDIFKITGSAQGRVKKGNDVFAWQSEITEPLIKKFTCRWISKGIIKVRRQTTAATSPWVATLDFGNGDCDNKATLTINGNSRQITLR